MVLNKQFFVTAVALAFRTNQISKFFAALSSDWCCTWHKIWGKLADCCACSPQECFKEDSVVNRPEANKDVGVLNDLASSKMMESPTTRKHNWYFVTFVSCKHYLSNVGTEIKDKSMQTSSQPDWTHDAQANPIRSKDDEVNDILTMLNNIWIKIRNLHHPSFLARTKMQVTHKQALTIGVCFSSRTKRHQ